MKNIGLTLFLLTGLINCKTTVNTGEEKAGSTLFTVAFGSCNKLTLENLLWDDISAENPDLWIWGGDIVYADTEDISVIQGKYEALYTTKGYRRLRKKVPVIGTWDDHDYGLNDGGEANPIKRLSQQAFLDFMGVRQDHPRRMREGIYSAHEYEVPNGAIKVIVLDTRYFRTSLTPDKGTDTPYKPNAYGEGTMLGEVQWRWLEEQLLHSQADFNVIVSSIQVLSDKHGFESWGNFPHERDRLIKLLGTSGAKGVLILSGDRHISEFSKTLPDGLDYPLIEFTSSGLTHVYSDFHGELNPYRVGQVVATQSFGLIQFDIQSREVIFRMIGDDGVRLGELHQTY